MDRRRDVGIELGGMSRARLMSLRRSHAWFDFPSSVGEWLILLVVVYCYRCIV